MWLRGFLYKWYEYRLERVMAIYVFFMLGVVQVLFKWWVGSWLMGKVTIFIMLNAIWLDHLCGDYMIMWLRYYKRKGRGYEETVRMMYGNILCPSMSIEVYKKLEYPSIESVHSRAGAVAEQIIERGIKI